MTTTKPRRADIDSFYTCAHPDKFAIDWRAFYESAEQRTDALRSRVAHVLDVAYGPAERQRLDVYYPSGVTDAPVLLFLHGGGFREGDPTLYGFLAEPYVARGYVFATVGYRLTPETYLPETFTDVSLALGWVDANIATYGGSAARVVLSGHSAGGILTAQAAVSGASLSAAVPISGIYDFRPGAEYVANAADLERSSPLLNITSWPKATLVAYGENENRPNYGTDSASLVEKLKARGATAELLELVGMDHKDTVDALSDESSELFKRVASLLSKA